MALACGALVVAAAAVAVASGTISLGSQSGRSAAPAAPAAPTSTPSVRGPAPVAAGSPSSAARLATPVAPGTLANPSLPPPNGGLDYQLGGAYPPPAGVEILARDRTDPPAAGIYSICYVNGFQTQPGESQWWLDTHPTLVLRDTGGNPIIDPDWPDEYILDISSPTKRSAIAGIVGPWISGCATSGYQAVEIDNLDTYTRFPDRLAENDAVAMVTAFATSAHASGLAIGQKNSAELVPRRLEAGLDFVVAEECSQFDECDVYTAGYGDRVLVIEYQRPAFTQACTEFPNLSVVLRDRNLATPSSGGYVRDAC